MKVLAIYKQADVCLITIIVALNMFLYYKSWLNFVKNIEQIMLQTLNI